MNSRSTDTSDQVPGLAPKEKPRDDGDLMDQLGREVVAMLQRVANLWSDNCDRAMTEAHKVSVQLRRATEDRIKLLQAEIEQFKDRAVRAEGWLQVIQKEIE